MERRTRTPLSIERWVLMAANVTPSAIGAKASLRRTGYNRSSTIVLCASRAPVFARVDGSLRKTHRAMPFAAAGDGRLDEDPH
jgi:hypothetical protein